jgi:uncharacterized membrane protein YcaP (DUF421 family)
VLGALAGAGVLLALSSFLDVMAGRDQRARHLLEGRAVLLVEKGWVNEPLMRRLAVDLHDLHAAIRKSGLARLADVEYAVLELDGSISVIQHDDDGRPYAESREQYPPGSRMSDRRDRRLTCVKWRHNAR